MFQELLKQCPGLKDRLLNNSDEEIDMVAELVSMNPAFIA